MIEPKEVPRLPCKALGKRGISDKTAKKYRVRIEYDQETGEEKNYYFPVYRDSKLVSYQRKPAVDPGGRKSAGDNPRYISKAKGHLPFGSHVVGDQGNFLLVTEGAEDALAVSEMLQQQGKNYRVVACLGSTSWKSQIEWYSRWNKVAICFDQDDEGQQAAQDFAGALSPGQGVIVQWQGSKDPNDLLKKGQSAAFYEAIGNAKPYRPSGLLVGEQVWDLIQNYQAPDYIPYPEEWESLNDKVDGIRRSEISLWCAGTGVGKTSFIRRLKQHIVSNTDWCVGEIELEEQPEKTARGMLEFSGRKAMSKMTNDEKRKAYENTYGTGRLFTLNHRASFTKGGSLLGKLKYMHYGEGADIIALDHITLAVSEFGDGNGGLVQQDQMMSEFLEFIEQTGVHLMLVSHLRKAGVGDKSFEAGAVPSMDDLKGSGSLKQIAFDIIGLSRNSQHEDEYERNVTQIHSLKCRETGNTGPADRLYWNGQDRCLEVARPEYEDNDDDLEF